MGIRSAAMAFAAGWLVLQCGAALAQEPPEAVYQKLHRAALAANLNEMLRHATDARRAEISAMPGGAEVVKLMATMMPRSYTVTGTTVSPDGGTALLRATGTGSFMGQSSQRHGAVNFLKEKGEWKVDRWEWSDKPGVTQSEPECEIKPVMSDEDLRRCGATPR